MLLDQIQHALWVFEHMPILQPQDRETGGIEKSFASFVPDNRGLTVVHGPFQLDDKSLFRAIEVNDVGSDAVLSPEFAALQL
jgi:hypothetical protein